MSLRKKKFVLVVTGPTASGKTAMAIALAKAFNTEIISADSRQLYREMSIGTAVPSTKELQQVPHHFIHCCSVGETFDVARYEKEVLLLLEELFQKHDIVVLSGGTGLYIDAVCRGLDVIPKVKPETREKVSDFYKQFGLKGLQNAVAEYDPEYFKTVDQQNPRRLQRALEVFEQTGLPFSFYHKKAPKKRDFEVVWTAIDRDKNELHSRINQRVEKMMAEGLLAEAKNLVAFRQFNALNTVGYKELFAYFDGKISLDEAVEQIKTNTRKYAKRQLTWLRKNKGYHWFKANELPKLIQYVETAMNP
ncbi:MAG: tRNA (adenosine(37)-N6)-dimethylallyltransferase MiaA [Bacteroidales bacterium]|nr:tRNA (adenosine(37)-N6)-dimethylallyltransferase MiaA [Bacteroidales bacterium]